MLTDLKRRREVVEGSMNITEFPEKNSGCPLLLGEELDPGQVQAYLSCFRESGVVVNTAIVMDDKTGTYIVKWYILHFNNSFDV